jgi:hypothetical protein
METRQEYITLCAKKKMEDTTGIDMFPQATKYDYMEWLYLPLTYLCCYYADRDTFSISLELLK